MKRVLGAALLALLVPLLAATGTARATAAAPPSDPAPRAAVSGPCHGYVYKFVKNQAANEIRMTYWIYCTRAVDHIQVRAFIRQGDRWAYNRKNCYDDNVCETVVRMDDIAGSQLYTARAVEGGDLADVAYAEDGSKLWGCSDNGSGIYWGDPMNCTGDGNTW